MSRWNIIIAIVALGAATLTPAVLAQRAEPFSTVSVGIAVSHDVHDARFQSSWEVSPAIDVSAGLPFYYGNIRAGVRILHAYSPELTDINSAYMHVAWGPTVDLGRSLSFDASVSAGSMYMSFTDEPVSFRKSESELAVGLRGGMSARVGGPIRAHVYCEWQHAFTSIPLDLVFVSAGLAYELQTPDWLRSFLD